MSPWLVTGAAGFLGSHLCQRLLDEGQAVLGLDCLREPRTVKESNLQLLLGRRGFQFLPCDLSRDDLGPLVRGCRGVVHLAAMPGVTTSWGGDFAPYCRDNVLATQRLLEACRPGELQVVVLASSSSVYGQPGRLPTPEDEPLRPVSPYGVTKVAAEHLGRVYHQAFGLPVVILRYFTLYGPRQRPDMACHRFLQAVAQGRPLTLYGGGTQTRDFTYVADAVEATLAALQRGVPGRVYNVGGGSRCSLLQVLEVLEAVLGRRLARQHQPARAGEATDTAADISRARADLGYEPRVTLEQGLNAMASWFFSKATSSPGSREDPARIP